jgi:hypothetical protein
LQVVNTTSNAAFATTLVRSAGNTYSIKINIPAGAGNNPFDAWELRKSTATDEAGNTIATADPLTGSIFN